MNNSRRQFAFATHETLPRTKSYAELTGQMGCGTITASADEAYADLSVQMGFPGILAVQLQFSARSRMQIPGCCDRVLASREMVQ